MPTFEDGAREEGVGEDVLVDFAVAAEGVGEGRAEVLLAVL